VGEVHEGGDEIGIGCELARSLVSASADDELSRSDEPTLDRHLSGCIECSAYADRVSALTRAVRLRPAPVDLGLVDRVITRSRPARLGRGGWLRPALAWCGLLIVVQSARPLVMGELDGAPTHVARHAGAFSLALGIGLLYAAWKPHRAFGLLPLVGALLATTLVGGILDVATGTRAPFAEIAHLAEIIGMLLLWLVAGSPGWERVRDLWRSLRPGVAKSTT